MRTILRILITFILTGMASTWAAIDADGRIGTVLSEEKQIVLSNIHVFDVVGGVLKETQDILIEGTQIKAVGRIDASDKDVNKIDLSGKFAFPGLFECHTHLALLTTKKEEEMIEDLRSFVANGITQVRDVGGSISPGMLANLVILDENPLEDIAYFESPYMVIMNGRVVFTRSN